MGCSIGFANVFFINMPNLLVNHDFCFPCNELGTCQIIICHHVFLGLSAQIFFLMQSACHVSSICRAWLRNHIPLWHASALWAWITVGLKKIFALVWSMVSYILSLLVEFVSWYIKCIWLGCGCDYAVSSEKLYSGFVTLTFLAQNDLGNRKNNKSDWLVPFTSPHYSASFPCR